jgi:pimeloyl-ACP methyl ester carboxylesterase
MSAQTHETAPTRFVEANGIRFAYRRFGGGEGLPMLFCQHFTGTMDNWDPIVTNTLAQEREVILFDNQGVGSSSGKTPDSVQAMTTDALAFVDALGLKRIDLLGFSLGGMVAQQIVLDRPKLVRYLILAGTGPEGGERIACVICCAIGVIRMREIRPNLAPSKIIFPSSSLSTT